MHVTQIYMPTGGFDKQSVYCINKRKSVVLHPAVFYSYFQCISNASTTLQLMIGSVFPRNCFIPAVFAWAPALTLKHTCSYSRVRVAWLESRPTSTSAHTSWNTSWEKYEKQIRTIYQWRVILAMFVIHPISGKSSGVAWTQRVFPFSAVWQGLGDLSLAFPVLVNLESPLMANMCIGRTRVNG